MEQALIYQAAGLLRSVKRGTIAKLFLQWSFLPNCLQNQHSFTKNIFKEEKNCQ